MSSNLDIEACAITIHSAQSKICILSIYRAPSGNFSHFIKTLNDILQFLYKPNIEFFICGDFNINYLKDTLRKNQLNSLLTTYNLFSTVDFPTRIQKKSSTAIDNIFIDISKKEEYRIYSVINGLSDRDAQLITIYNIVPYLQENNILTIRKFNENSLNEFKNKLSLETWEDIFNEDDINNMFNAFLNRFLIIYYSTFPKKTINIKTKKN